MQRRSFRAFTAASTLTADLFAASPSVVHLDRGQPMRRTVLTFDDGPHPTHTPRALDVLDEVGLPATFFVVGRAINRKSYALVQRIARAGHDLGSHSYNHDIEMASRGRDAEHTIFAQHEICRCLIQLALAAESGDDFDQLYRRVVGLEPRPFGLQRKRLPEGAPAIRGRLDDALRERGQPARPVLVSRPPGGGPYLGWAPLPRRRYDRALVRLGMANVMWHRQAGDVHPTRGRDAGFIRHNVRRAVAAGGVLLLHDFAPPAGLRKGLRDALDHHGRAAFTTLAASLP